MLVRVLQARFNQNWIYNAYGVAAWMFCFHPTSRTKSKLIPLKVADPVFGQSIYSLPANLADLQFPLVQ